MLPIKTTGGIGIEARLFLSCRAIELRNECIVISQKVASDVSSQGSSGSPGSPAGLGVCILVPKPDARRKPKAMETLEDSEEDILVTSRRNAKYLFLLKHLVCAELSELSQAIDSTRN